MSLIKQLDKNLLHLAWSLWTELGVLGVEQKHQNTLILVEELIIFTSVLSEVDPRLRDESLDWCSQFYRFISVSRLKSLIKEFEEFKEPFSNYVINLNSVSQANWPVFTKALPLKINLSRKSTLRPYTSPALLNLRARSVFGTGARADLLTFFLAHPNADFSVAEVNTIGYSKRNLAEVLDELHFGKLLDKFKQGNQLRYRLNKTSPLFQLLKPIPKCAPSWHSIFKIVLSLRDCILRTKDFSESTQVVEIRNCLQKYEATFQKIGQNPPPFQNNFKKYLKNFSQWLLQWTSSFASGKDNL